MAACTSATIRGVGESEVMSQPAPTSCIQVPMLDTIEAIHNMRKTLCCSGAQGEMTKGLSGLRLMAIFLRAVQGLFPAAQRNTGLQAMNGAVGKRSIDFVTHG